MNMVRLVGHKLVMAWRTRAERYKVVRHRTTGFAVHMLVGLATRKLASLAAQAALVGKKNW